jgi:heme o synthase
MKAAAAAMPRPTALRDLWQMTKPGITLMVVVTAAAGFVLGARDSWPLLVFAHTLLGTALVSAGSSVLNQVWERDRDGLMRRTAARPIPAGRLAADQGLLWGVLLAMAGLAELAFGVNLLTAALGASTLALYVFLYTPLKPRTSLATLIGAVPGAMPPVMGWAAVRDSLEPGAWALFAILFLWQLPHFLAIAWLYREDYARGGFPLLSVDDPDGHRTARQALFYGAALVPVSLVPTVLGLTAVSYAVGAAVLSVAYLLFAVRFALGRDVRTARQLMFASILYLPAVLIVLLLDRLASRLA